MGRGGRSSSLGAGLGKAVARLQRSPTGPWHLNQHGSPGPPPKVCQAVTLTISLP